MLLSGAILRRNLVVGFSLLVSNGIAVLTYSIAGNNAPGETPWAIPRGAISFLGDRPRSPCVVVVKAATPAFDGERSLHDDYSSR